MAAIRPAKQAAKKQAPAAPAPEAPPPPPPAAKNRSMMVPAIVIAVALLLAAFMLKGGGGGGGETHDSSTPTSAAPADDGDIIALDPITMNLASGDILKVGIALQLAGPKASPEAEEAIENPKAFGARALDELIAVLNDYTRDELSQSGGLSDAKEKLSKRLGLVYHDEVTAVYFTQFVIA